MYRHIWLVSNLAASTTHWHTNCCYDSLTSRVTVSFLPDDLCTQLWDAEVFRITQTTFVPLSTRAYLELVQDVGKLLASGRFYFAYPSTGTTFDLLSCAQKQGKEQSHFFW